MEANILKNNAITNILINIIGNNEKLDIVLLGKEILKSQIP